MHYADIFYQSDNGLRLYARDYPGPSENASVVMCLPGLTRNSKDFAALAEHLRVRHRVICPDLRGRARSARDPNPDNYRPDVYARDMLSLIDLLGLAHVSVIGTSLGGLMAMLMCMQAPARIDRVVLNDVGPELDPRGIARIAGYVGKSAPVANWRDAAQRIAQIYAPTFPDYVERDWLAMAHDSFVQEGADLVMDYDPAIAKAIAAGGAAPNLWPLFDVFATKPLLVIRGELSDILSAEIMDKMIARNAHLHAVVVPNRGHAPTLIEPVALTAIEEFLSSN